MRPVTVESVPYCSTTFICTLNAYYSLIKLTRLLESSVQRLTVRIKRPVSSQSHSTDHITTSVCLSVLFALRQGISHQGVAHFGAKGAMSAGHDEHVLFAIDGIRHRCGLAACGQASFPQ